MKPHGLRAAPVQGVSSIQRTVLYNGMRHQFGVVCQYPLVEIAFPMHLDLVPRLRYVFYAGHGSFLTLGEGVTNPCLDVTKR